MERTIRISVRSPARSGRPIRLAMIPGGSPPRRIPVRIRRAAFPVKGASI